MKRLLKILVILLAVAAAGIVAFAAKADFPEVKFAEVTDEESLVNELIRNFETGYEAVVVRTKGFSPEEDKISRYLSAEIANDGEDLCIMPPGYTVNIFSSLNIWIFRIDYSQESEQSSEDGEKRTTVSYEPEEVETAQRQVSAALDQACLQISEDAQMAGGGTVETYRAIFRYLCNTIEYDYELSDAIIGEDLTNPLRKNRGVYGALVCKKTVCSGYAGAYKAICDRLGLPCWVAESTDHAWNLILADGQVYCVDSTSGDQESWIADQFFMITPEKYAKEYGYSVSEQCYIPPAFSG